MIAILDKLSYAFILLTVALVPLYVDKNLVNGFVLAKQYLFISLLLGNVLFFSIKTILEKRIFYRRSILDIPFLILLLVALVSSLFSIGLHDSFLGRNEIFVLNFVFLFFLIIFYFLLVNIVNTPERWRGVLDMLLVVGGVAAFLSILKLAFKIHIPLAGESLNVIDATSSAFGLWIIPVFVISLGSAIKKNLSVGRSIFYISIAILCIIPLLLIGFSFFWWVLLAGLILLLLLGVSFLQDARLSWLSVIFGLLILTSICIAFGSPKSWQVAVPAEASLDARPSWFVTRDVLFSGVKNFLIGSGLGTFAADFSRYRTTDFNYHPTAWNMRFNQPSNSFFAFLSEGGVLMALGFVFILLFVLGHVLTTWFKARGSSFAIAASLNLSKKNIRLDIFLTVVAWLVLWIGILMNFFNLTLWVLWFLLLGITISGMSLLGHTVVKDVYITLEDTPQYNLIFSFSMIVVMAGVIMVGILGGRFYLADRAYAQAMQETDYEKIATSLQKVLSLRNNYDTYHVSLSRAYLVRAGEVSKEPNPDIQVVGNLLQRSVSEARAATDISPQSVSVWENLATAYENTFYLAPEAGEWVVKTLNTATELEPTNPILFSRLASDYVSQKNLSKAIEYFQKSIDLKKDYLASYIGLASAYEANQEIDKAVDVYKTMVQGGAGNNSEILFNFGRLLYNRGTKKDKADAEKLWLEVVRLQPNYSNALYSLALLYENKNDKQKALEYYYKVKDLNPGNKDVVEKIKSLVSGK